MDGHEVGHNNAAVAKNGVPLSVEHMVMHVLAKGNVYDISERKFYAGPASFAENGRAGASE